MVGKGRKCSRIVKYVHVTINGKLPEVYIRHPCLYGNSSFLYCTFRPQPVQPLVPTRDEDIVHSTFILGVGMRKA